MMGKSDEYTRDIRRVLVLSDPVFDENTLCVDDSCSFIGADRGSGKTSRSKPPNPIVGTGLSTGVGL
jgi:hypothetical protein